MTTYATRPYGQGWIAGVAKIRERDGEPDIDIRHAKRAATALKALRAVLDAHPPERSAKATSEPGDGRARPSRTKQPASVDDLSDQARQVLHHLILRRGLTARMATQMSPPCYSLSQRISEIRMALGADAVETEYRTNDAGRRYGIYRWRGPAAVQIEMSEEAA